MATQVTSTVQQPSQIDYALRQVQAPKYKMMKIPLNNLPSASATIGATSSVTLEWKLPTRVYNLARSYISYNINVTAQGAGKHAVSFEDVFDLGNAISFGSAGGVDLVNLQYAQNFTKIARKLTTPIDDYLGNDAMSSLYKSSALGTANVYPVAYDGATYITTDNYLENQYIFPGTANTALNSYRQFPLGAFTGTLLGIDRDFYSPVEQYIRVQAGTGDKMAFTVATADQGAPGVSAASTSGVTTINDVYLYLAVEQNPGIVDSMIAKYYKGELMFRIPYTTAFKNVGGPANAQTNIQIQLSQQYGKRLKKILHTVWHPQEKLNTAYDCSNWNGSKVLNYQTFLDSIPIQDRIQSCLRPNGLLVSSDDWLENKKHMDRRSMYLSRNHYSLNWFHLDQFFEPHDKDGSLPEVNLDEGLLMDSAKQWLFSSTAGATAGLLHYTYVEFARDIAITPAGPVFV